MVQQALLQPVTDERLEHIWAELVAKLEASSSLEAGLAHDRMRWLRPGLTQLLDAASQPSSEPLAAMVRTRVLELMFIASAGDPALPHDHEAVVEQFIATLTETLEQLRSESADEGLRYLREATPPMCG